MGTMLCNEVVENTKTSRCFKAHVVIGVTVSVGLLALWTFVSLFMNQWPWFIYPAGVFLITISFHHLIVSREKKCTLTFHMILYGTLNSIVFITWLCSTILVNQSNYSVWFIYFLFGTSIPLAIHFILEKYPTSPHKYLYIHGVIFLILNILCFFIYMDAGKGFPWFMYTLTGSVLFLLIHYDYEYHVSCFIIHTQIFIDGLFIVFFTWVVTGMSFPWWFFITLLWSFFLYIHHRVDAANRKIKKEVNDIKKENQDKENNQVTINMETKDSDNDNDNDDSNDDNNYGDDDSDEYDDSDDDGGSSENGKVEKESRKRKRHKHKHKHKKPSRRDFIIIIDDSVPVDSEKGTNDHQLIMD